MIPVDQTTFSDPERGIRGGCLQACVASILELPLKDVPHFGQIAQDTNRGDYFVIEDWCVEQGLWPVEFTLKGGGFGAPIYCILSGPSPRGIVDKSGIAIEHSVVAGAPIGRAEICKMVHDPHPDRTGLDGPPSRVMYFVAMDPAAAIRGAKMS